MRTAILGFGLIGGSLARALHAREPGRWSVAAWSPTGAGPADAARDRTIAFAADSVEAAVAGADLVVLAAPPLACLELLDRLASMALDDRVVVTDVASTKARIVARAEELRLPFVGGHPMTGREQSGYGAADPALFVDRPWIVTGPSRPVERLVAAAGARPVTMAADEHDAAVAAISHAPLVLSAALAEAVASRVGPDLPDPRALAAGGWASMTRLARGDVEMGAGILGTNARAVSMELRAVRAVLDSWLALLDADAPDTDALRKRLAAARDGLDGP